MPSSTGLPARLAIALAYSGWWVTGSIVWFLERRDPVVRFHAAQAVTAFGAITLLILLFSALTALSLSFLPSMFGFFGAAAGATWVLGAVIWATAMWKTASGDKWRIPVAGEWAERLISYQLPIASCQNGEPRTDN